MPTHRESLRRLSVAQLVELTDMAGKTVIGRLRAAGLKPAAKDGRTLRYDPQLALPALYEAATPQAERARLDKARAVAQELRNAVTRGELVPAADQLAALVNVVLLMKGRMLAVPAALAHELAVESSAAGCEAIVARALEAALREFAEAGREAERELDAAPEPPAAAGARA